MHSGQLVDLPLLIVDLSFFETWIYFYDPLVALSRRGIFSHPIISLRSIVVCSQHYVFIRVGLEDGIVFLDGLDVIGSIEELVRSF